MNEPPLNIELMPAICPKFPGVSSLLSILSLPLSIRFFWLFYCLLSLVCRHFALPGVQFEDLVETLLKLDLMPAVCPEFPGITVGGAVSGGGLESTSFRHGQVFDTCCAFEVLLPGTAESVWVRRPCEQRGEKSKEEKREKREKDREKKGVCNESEREEKKERRDDRDAESLTNDKNNNTNINNSNSDNSPLDASDLFFSIQHSYGTIALLLAIEMKIVRAHPRVCVQYSHFSSVSAAVSAMDRICACVCTSPLPSDPTETGEAAASGADRVDFLDGVVLAEDSGE